MTACSYRIGVGGLRRTSPEGLIPCSVRSAVPLRSGAIVIGAPPSWATCAAILVERFPQSSGTTTHPGHGAGAASSRRTTGATLGREQLDRPHHARVRQRPDGQL